MTTPTVLASKPADSAAASRFRSAAIAIAIYVALDVAWLELGWGGDAITQAFSDISGVACASVATIACLVAWRRSAEQARRAWLLLAAASASWAVGELIWTYYEIVLRREVPFPSLADVGFLVAYPLAAVAMMTFPTAPSEASSRARTALDGLVVGVSLLYVSWAFLLGPLFREGGVAIVEKAIGLAYPVFDIVVAAIVALVITRAPRGSRSTLAFIAAGLVALAVADSAFAYLALQDEYATGGAVDAAWDIGYLLIALAAIKRAIGAAPGRNEIHRARLLLPYAAVALAVSVAGWTKIFVGTVEPVLFWGMLLIVLLVCVRLLVTLMENFALTRDLETKIVERTAALTQSEERHRSLVQNSSDVVTILDNRGVVTYHSPASERVFGYGADQIVGKRFVDFLHPDDRGRAEAFISRAMRRPGATAGIEWRIVRANGTWLHCESVGTNLLGDPTVEGFVLNTRDISERKLLEDQLRQQAFHDPLTKLANRALFRDRTEHALRRAARHSAFTAVLFCDLDSFKVINDSLGHVAGDKLLCAVSERLRRCIRDEDTVARLGGDEFAILLEECRDEDTAIAIANRILEALREPFLLDGNEAFAGTSIGIAISSGGESGVEELLRNADLAMYVAKGRGKGRAEVFREDMHTAVRDRMELEADLRHAVSREELRLFYQPIIELSSGRIVTMEALMRWDHPERRLLMPSEFLSLGEETGLIVSMGRWALEEACRQTKAWQLHFKTDPPLSVAVNLSYRQLDDAELVVDVKRSLARSGLAAGCLILEIAESAMFQDNPAIASRLHELKRVGVRIAIDDFGTGYSSLGTLRDLPIDLLKLDPTFISELGAGLQQAAVVRAIMRVAQTMRVETVAEGVESPEQLAQLLNLQCTLGQGYHFAPPASAAHTEELLGMAAAEGWRRGRGVGEDTTNAPWLASTSPV